MTRIWAIYSVNIGKGQSVCKLKISGPISKIRKPAFFFYNDLITDISNSTPLVIFK